MDKVSDYGHGLLYYHGTADWNVFGVARFA